MVWFWSTILILFPTWLFSGTESFDRVKALLFFVIWISASGWFLSIWKRNATPFIKHFDHQKESSTRIDSLFIFILFFLGGINLIPARYPLTSSGDEAFHARMFRTIGYGIEGLVSKNLSGPPYFWYIFAVLFVIIISMLLWKFLNSSYHRITAFLLASVLILLLLTVIPFLWKNGEALILSVASKSEPLDLTVLIRYPPLAKFLWLPASLFNWRSVFVLRIPAIACWLISGLIFYHTVKLKNDSYVALFPALYLLVLPGMFYYAHLVYLTTPMLMMWCIALYCFERYFLSKERIFLIFCALALNIGTLLRRETAFFAISICIYWVLDIFYNRKIEKNNLLDLIGLVWIGISPMVLWQVVMPELGPTSPQLYNIIKLERLFSLANDFPFHIGLFVFCILLVSIYFIIIKRRPSIYSQRLVTISIITIAVTYLVYALILIYEDDRMIGIISFGREQQTANRYLVSWSPFIALILAAGVGQIRNRNWNIALGFGLALILLLQATFWRAPLTLPEYTSIRLQPGTEYPHLPAAEVVEHISNEFMSGDTKILIHRQLAVRYYSDLQQTSGIWIAKNFNEENLNTVDKIITYCEKHAVEIIVLPLIWMEWMTMDLKLPQNIMSNDNFRVNRVFTYLNKPAVLVADYIH